VTPHSSRGIDRIVSENPLTGREIPRGSPFLADTSLVLTTILQMIPKIDQRASQISKPLAASRTALSSNRKPPRTLARQLGLHQPELQKAQRTVALTRISLRDAGSAIGIDRDRGHDMRCFFKATGEINAKWASVLLRLTLIAVIA